MFLDRFKVFLSIRQVILGPLTILKQLASALRQIHVGQGELRPEHSRLRVFMLLLLVVDEILQLLPGVVLAEALPLAESLEVVLPEAGIGAHGARQEKG